MSAKRNDVMLGELMAVIADYLSAGEDDGDLRGRVRCWLDVAEGRVCESDTAGRLAGGPAPIDRARVLVDLLKAQPAITTTELAKRSAICAETARLYLRKLAARRVVRAIGSKKGRIWIAGVCFSDFAITLDKRFSDISTSYNSTDGREGGAEASPVGAGQALALSEVMA